MEAVALHDGPANAPTPGKVATSASVRTSLEPGTAITATQDGPSPAFNFRRHASIEMPGLAMTALTQMWYTAAELRDDGMGRDARGSYSSSQRVANARAEHVDVCTGTTNPHGQGLGVGTTQICR